MSVKVMGWVFDLNLPTREKFVLLAYADHADHDGKNVYPAIQTVARKTGYDERTVQRATQELQKMGLLINDGTGPKGTHKWRIDKQWGGVTHSHPVPQSPRPTVTGGVTHSPKRGVPQSPDPSLTVIKPSSQQAMFGALCKVTELDGSLNGTKIGQFSKRFIQAGYLAEQVEEFYSARGWWYENDWRGQKGQPPTLEQISATIKRAIQESIPPAKEGTHMIELPDGSIVEANL